MMRKTNPRATRTAGWLGALALALALGAAACGGNLPPFEAGDMGSDGGAGDMGLLPFGSACTSGAQCASDVCFVGGMRSFCSLHCTMATAAQDCPMPPTSGQCNLQGFCKP